ncbi:MAG: DUF3892 domain-containing protein [Myxococcota bacterium]
MSQRQVLRTGKDRDGDIIRLCGATFTVPKQTAVRHIRDRVHRYYVNVRGAQVDVVVRTRGGKPYLTTDPDGTKRNNLAELPPC